MYVLREKREEQCYIKILKGCIRTFGGLSLENREESYDHDKDHKSG